MTEKGKSFLPQIPCFGIALALLQKPQEENKMKKKYPRIRKNKTNTQNKENKAEASSLGPREGKTKRKGHDSISKDSLPDTKQ